MITKRELLERYVNLWDEIQRMNDDMLDLTISVKELENKVKKMEQKPVQKKNKTAKSVKASKQLRDKSGKFTKK